ncbi:MAG TPA: hypothetical protein VMG41_04335 [Gemmatimonadales bacterium]|nr:hypothetical protein [Gemmatimonadales bacterium]
MKSIPRPLGGLLLLLGACGGTQFATVTASPFTATPTVFDCVQSQLAPLGYQRTSYDIGAHRITAQRIDTTVTSPDRLFRRRINRLIVDIHPAADGTTAFKIEGHTVDEYSTVRGPTEIERSASDAVKGAAAALIDACGK